MSAIPAGFGNGSTVAPIGDHIAHHTTATVAGDQIGDRGARVANPETVRSVLHNVLRFSCAAVIERGGIRAEATFQKSPDLARRAAASTASAGWAAESKWKAFLLSSYSGATT